MCLFKKSFKRRSHFWVKDKSIKSRTPLRSNLIFHELSFALTTHISARIDAVSEKDVFSLIEISTFKITFSGKNTFTEERQSPTVFNRSRYLTEQQQLSMTDVLCIFQTDDFFHMGKNFSFRPMFGRGCLLKLSAFSESTALLKLSLGKTCGWVFV